MKQLTVRELLERAETESLPFHVLAGGGGLERHITTGELHRPGLALVGHYFHRHPERVQVFGETEITFLAGRTPAQRREVLEVLASTPETPCFVVTKGQEPPAELVTVCDRHDLPLLRSDEPTGELTQRLRRMLVELLAPTTIVHGVLVDVFGVGVLLRGPSGIGKSECALELVLRGHRLVADDMVELHRLPPGVLIGRSVELIKHHMEIRGLGVINVQDLFGVAAVRDHKRLEIVVHLEHWDADAYVDRIGIDPPHQEEILGVRIDRITIPIRPGRNLSELIEVAARNRILKIRGVDSAQRFQKRLLQELQRARPSARRAPPGSETEQWE